MMKNKLLIILSFAVVLGLLSIGFNKDGKKDNRLAKTNINDDNEYIAINDILMWISNNGMGSHNPQSDDSGFYWPGGENATITAIFSDGLIWGAIVGGEIRTGGATYRYGMQAGKILQPGIADDPSLDKYRVYRIRKNANSITNPELKENVLRDIAEWPVEDGAPWVDVDGDGVYNPAPGGEDTPDFLGDEVLWCVSNDLDASRTTFLYGTLPLGLEIHTTVFGFNRTGDLGNMVFKKYMLVNKSSRDIEQMVLGYWSDTDLGDANDDFTGCDTVLSLGYTYNGDNDDADYYGPNPPAIGYDFFQGPIVPATQADSAKFLGGWRHGFTNLPMTAFTFYINSSTTYSDPDLGVAAGSEQMYNYLTGKVWNGDPFIDPTTNEETNFVLAGDPVAKTGWFEGPDGWPGGSQVPGDRRHLMASGPFTMAVGDTQEVVVGIIIARGANNINSITELKRTDIAAQIAYDLDFDITDPPLPPNVFAFSGDRQITLWWEQNSESYEEANPLIFNLGLDDTTYSFEGYRVWQFSDITGANATLLGTFDIANGVNQITEQQSIGGTVVTVTLFETPDQGTTTYFDINEDVINRGPLVNGTPYYFAVTAYGYNQYSAPQVLESSPVILEIYPRRPNIDESYSVPPGGSEQFALTEGQADARVTYTVVDPLQLKDAKYTVEIGGVEGAVNWTLLRENVDPTADADTLLDKFTVFGSDSEYVNIRDGFYVRVYDDGRDELSGDDSHIKAVQEIVNGNIETANLFNSFNSTGDWQIKADVEGDAVVNDLNLRDNLGINTYEIRFTQQGSQYYTTNYASLNGLTNQNDPLAANRVPFEIWNLGEDIASDTDDVRLVPKVKDFDPFNSATWTTRDSVWTQKANGEWEAIYALDWIPYAEPLPDPAGRARNNNLMIGNIVIQSAPGVLPAPGTVIRFTTWRPLVPGIKFQVETKKSSTNNTQVAKSRVDEITVYPNPYYGTHSLEASKYNRFVRFLGLPTQATIRIFSLSGVYINRIDKDSQTDFVDWNLSNDDGLPVASGIYLAHIEMPGVGEKILKIAIIREAQYIDRI